MLAEVIITIIIALLLTVFRIRNSSFLTININIRKKLLSHSESLLEQIFQSHHDLKKKKRFDLFQKGLDQLLLLANMCVSQFSNFVSSYKKYFSNYNI